MVYGGDTAVRLAFSYNMKDPIGTVPVPYGLDADKNVSEVTMSLGFYGIPITYKKNAGKY